MKTERLPRVVAALGFVVLVTACAGMSEQDKQAAAGAHKLTNVDAHAMLADHTVSGKTAKGNNWVEYYVADGTIRGLFKGTETYAATWRVEGDKVCFDYADNQFDGCTTIAINGDKLFWFNDDGTPRGRPAMIVAGNTQSL